jgi:mycothiol synthase
MTEFELAVDLVQPIVDDAEAIAEIVNALERHHYGEEAVGVEEVERWFRLPKLELWVAKVPGGKAAAYADLYEEADGLRYWLDLREHPGRREVGGARAVLRVAEERARARALEGALLRGAAASEDRPLRRLYEESGYEVVRHNLEMRIALDSEPPAPQWPAGIVVRTLESAEDERRVYEADMETFADHWEFVRGPFDEWRAWLIDDQRFDPSLWFLAEEGAELAGFCLGVLHASGDPTFGHISVLGVRRPWRRRGLGLALLQYAFHEFRRRGMTRAGLTVDAENLTGAVRLYERAGMRVVKSRVTYEKRLGGHEPARCT